MFKWFKRDKCKHDWSLWSEQVSTYDGIYQYSYCNICNMVRSYRRKGYWGSNNTSNLAVWNNPKVLDQRKGADDGA